MKRKTQAELTDNKTAYNSNPAHEGSEYKTNWGGETVKFNFIDPRRLIVTPISIELFYRDDLLDRLKLIVLSRIVFLLVDWT